MQEKQYLVAMFTGMAAIGLTVTPWETGWRLILPLAGVGLVLVAYLPLTHVDSGIRVYTEWPTRTSSRIFGSVDPEHTSGSSTLIRAAGGLLWRNTAGGLLLAVVHRSRYEEETRTLPKGKLNPGESWLEAAMREVKEETGYQPRVLGFAGAIAYVAARGPKIVRFWNMTPGSTEQAGLDETEVISVAWLPPAEAIQQLSYPLEKVMVETWQNQISPSLRA